VKHHRGDTPSWGCAPPLNHVPEGMRLFVLASLELPMCILLCQPRWCPHALLPSTGCWQLIRNLSLSFRTPSPGY
jgi:hypothetical protein